VSDAKTPIFEQLEKKSVLHDEGNQKFKHDLEAALDRIISKEDEITID